MSSRSVIGCASSDVTPESIRGAGKAFQKIEDSVSMSIQKGVWAGGTLDDNQEITNESQLMGQKLPTKEIQDDCLEFLKDELATIDLLPNTISKMRREIKDALSISMGGSPLSEMLTRFYRLGSQHTCLQFTQSHMLTTVESLTRDSNIMKDQQATMIESLRHLISQVEAQGEQLSAGVKSQPQVGQGVHQATIRGMIIGYISGCDSAFDMSKVDLFLAKNQDKVDKYSSAEVLKLLPSIYTRCRSI